MADAKQEKKKPINILNAEDVAPELLASAIVDIAAAAKKLCFGPLKRRAVCLLIRDATGVGLQDIETVLLAAAALDDKFVNKSPAVK